MRLLLKADSELLFEYSVVAKESVARILIAFLDESLLGYENPKSKNGLFIDLHNYQSVGMAHLALYCEKFNSDIGGIFLRFQDNGEGAEGS